MAKFAAMLAKATERAQPVRPAAAGSPTGRFARDPSEYGRGRDPDSVQLTLIPGGAIPGAPATTVHATDDDGEDR